MSPPFGGVVATSTTNSPVSSRSFLRYGVVGCQAWLFWPSTIKALSGAAVTAAETARNRAASRVGRMGQGLTVKDAWDRHKDVLPLHPGAWPPARFSVCPRGEGASRCAVLFHERHSS